MLGVLVKLQLGDARKITVQIKEKDSAGFIPLLIPVHCVTRSAHFNLPALGFPVGRQGR